MGFLDEIGVGEVGREESVKSTEVRAIEADFLSVLGPVAHSLTLAA